MKVIKLMERKCHVQDIQTEVWSKCQTLLEIRRVKLIVCVKVIAGTMKRIQIALLFVVSALAAVPLSVRAQGSDDLCTFCIDIVGNTY